jgi:hypothetical protein
MPKWTGATGGSGSRPPRVDPPKYNLGLCGDRARCEFPCICLKCQQKRRTLQRGLLGLSRQWSHWFIFPTQVHIPVTLGNLLGNVPSSPTPLHLQLLHPRWPRCFPLCPIPSSLILIPLSLTATHPTFFKIVMPINVECFHSFLVRHPNRAFIDTIIKAFKRRLLAPSCDDPHLYLSLGDFPQRPQSPPSLDSACSQCAEEERLGGFSAPFTSANDPLLPGMISVPVHTVPKKSGKLRLVVDHSAGDFSPTSRYQFLPVGCT